MLASEKRKNVLLLLKDEPREMETLLESLDTTRTALLPQIKILRESHLISKEDDTYELTTIGKLIVDQMALFLRTAEMFAGDHGYLGTHYIDFVPEYLLKRLPEFSSFDVEDISINEFFDADKNFFEKALKSHYWMEITSNLHPTFRDFYVEMTDYVTDVSIIITQNVFEKAKKDYYEDLRELVALNLISIYLYPEKLDFVSFTMSQDSIKFKLFTDQGHIDNKRIIFSGSEVHDWGKEFFEYYKQLSTPIIEF